MGNLHSSACLIQLSRAVRIDIFEMITRAFVVNKGVVSSIGRMALESIEIIVAGPQRAENQRRGFIVNAKRL